MSGHASHHRPRISFDPLDLTRLVLTGDLVDRNKERANWREAVERELAHDERRDGKAEHLPPTPKLED